MTYAHILLGMIFIISIISFFSLAPWVPTRTSDLKRIQKLIKLKPKENFLEIGCGTAKVSLYIAKENPESFITGIELSPLFFLISKIKILCSRQKNIRIIYGNAFKKDLSLYEVLYVFGLPETVTEKLFPKLETEMKIGSRFFSYCFQMKNNFFEETKHKSDPQVYAIYEYKSIHKK